MATWESTASPSKSVADENSNRQFVLDIHTKKESSESGNSPDLCGVSPATSNLHFSVDDLRRIGMKESDIQSLVHKISVMRANQQGQQRSHDGHDSDAELHSDSLHALSQAPQTPPKTPAQGIGSTGTQGTEATLPGSITADSYTEPISAVAPAVDKLRGHPSPIELPPSPGGHVDRGEPPSRLSLDTTPLKRDHSFGYSFGSATGAAPSLKEEPLRQHLGGGAYIESPQLSQDSSCLVTPTNQLSMLGLASPTNPNSQPASPAQPQQQQQRVVEYRKPPPISVSGPLAGLDAISALCNLASTPTSREEAQAMRQELSPRKRPRRNVERRNWSTVLGQNETDESHTGLLGEAQCIDEEEEDAAAARALAGGSSVAKALAVARAPVQDTIANACRAANIPKPGGKHHSSHNNALVAVAMSSPRGGELRDSDEDEEVELETPEDEEDDEEWSPKDGDWSPKGRKIRGRGRGAPHYAGMSNGRAKAQRALMGRALPGMEDADDIELPVDVKKGGKIPELIRSKRAASGFVGVDFHEGKWRARVRIGVGIRGQPNRLVIGRYPTAGEAAIAYAKYVNSSAGKKLLAGRG